MDPGISTIWSPSATVKVHLKVTLFVGRRLVARESRIQEKTSAAEQVDDITVR